MSAICPSCPPIVAARGLPSSLMSAWKTLGINTLFLSETQNGQITQTQWRQAAATLGLKYIDYSSGSLSADDADPNLLAFVLPPLLPDQAGTVAATYSAAASAIRAVSTKPIYGLFTGSSITQNMNGVPPYNGSNQIPYLPSLDWVGDNWEPMNTDPSRYPTSMVGSAMQLLGNWSGGKPQLPFVETVFTNTNSNGRAPTPAEMRAEVDAIMSNPAALGWIFDPRVIAGGAIAFSFDGTDAPMKTAITQAVTAYTPVSSTRVVKYQLYNDFTWAAV